MVPAVKNKAGFMRRLTEAHHQLEVADAPLLTWGYHYYFYGDLIRSELDTINTERLIIVWARSCRPWLR